MDFFLVIHTHRNSLVAFSLLNYGKKKLIAKLSRIIAKPPR
jgi:hypothetical protein